jgi:hypothetical protein
MATGAQGRCFPIKRSDLVFGLTPITKNPVEYPTMPEIVQHGTIPVVVTLRQKNDALSRHPVKLKYKNAYGKVVREATVEVNDDGTAVDTVNWLMEPAPMTVEAETEECDPNVSFLCKYPSDSPAQNLLIHEYDNQGKDNAKTSATADDKEYGPMTLKEWQKHLKTAPESEILILLDDGIELADGAMISFHDSLFKWIGIDWQPPKQQQQYAAAISPDDLSQQALMAQRHCLAMVLNVRSGRLSWLTRVAWTESVQPNGYVFQAFLEGDKAYRAGDYNTAKKIFSTVNKNKSKL